MRYCVIDFETTGFSPPGSEVIEFAAVRVEDGEIGLNLSSLCRPVDSYISRKITDITGITAEMTIGKPSFSETLITLMDFIGNDTIVCHNIPFDMAFLDYYCRKADIELTNQTLCTLQLARKYFPNLPSRKLSFVASHLGIKATGFHRAMDDAVTTAKVLIKMQLKNYIS